MRQIKLPHMPSDVEARKSDLMTDLWYKGKETKIKQDKQNIIMVLDLTGQIQSSYQVFPNSLLKKVTLMVTLNS